MNAYTKYNDNGSKCMNILVHDKESLGRYNEMHNDKYIKTKINLYNINFYGNNIPKENERM